jgi:hypothetical protein
MHNTTPYELLSCSWPFPCEDGRFVPRWQAQETHLRPVLEWREAAGAAYWSIDWSELFRKGATHGEQARGFAVVFHIRVNAGGTLTFTSSGHCVIMRNESLLFDGSCCPQGQLSVAAGDILDIAVAHGERRWYWGASVTPAARAGEELGERHLPRVQARLAHASGPPLKIFTDARHPIRTVISLYSMILNGYAPSEILVYGDYQWNAFSARLLRQFLPFATFVPLEQLRDEVCRVAPASLIDVAQEHWFVMKTCVSLLCGPADFCMMDDDLFILKSLDGPLALARQCDFVFVPEADNAALYGSIWGDVFRQTTLARTGRVNTALYWLRMRKDRAESAAMMQQGIDKLNAAWAWEQGFYAHRFASEAVRELPAESYCYPFMVGLPGGMLGYDYANNPCGYTMIHFGGAVDKPNDRIALQLMPQILDRRSV